MLCLGEHIHRLDLAQLVEALGTEVLQVAGQSRRVAGDVENLPGTNFAQKGEDARMATAARRVQDDAGFAGRVAVDVLGQDFLGRADDEFTFGDAVALGIDAGRVDGLLIDFDSDEGFDLSGQLDAEETDPAIDIVEITHAAICQAILEGPDHPREHVEIILEEGVLADLPVLGLFAQDDFEAAARRRVLADMGDEAVDLRLHDGALLDIDHEAAIVLDEADMETLDMLIPLAADHDPVAVIPGTGVGHNGENLALGKAAQAVKDIADLLVLIFELGLVLDMLILAAAADAVIFAAGLLALGRDLQHFEELCPRVLALDLGDLGRDFFARNRKGNEDDEILHPADALAAKGQVADFQGQFIADIDAAGRYRGGFRQGYIGPHRGRCQMFTHNRFKLYSLSYSTNWASDGGTGR